MTLALGADFGAGASGAVCSCKTLSERGHDIDHVAAVGLGRLDIQPVALQLGVQYRPQSRCVAILEIGRIIAPFWRSISWVAS